MLVAGTAFAAVGYTTLVVTVGRLVEGRTGGFWLSLLGIAAGGAGLPAAAPQRRPAGQPARVRVARAAVRGAGRLQQPARRDALRRAPCCRRSPRPPPARSRPPAPPPPSTCPAATRSPAAWGADGRAPDHVVPVRTEGRDLGHDRGRPGPAAAGCAASDVRLLEALADQTAVAFRNTALASQLGRARRRARPDHPPAGGVAAADRRGRRRRPPGARGGDLPRRAAAPGRAAGRDPAGPRRPSRPARPTPASTSWSPAPTRRWRRCASSPAASSPPSWRGPGSEPALRSLVARSGAGADPDRRRARPARRFAAAGRGGRLLLLRRGRARRAPGRRSSCR